MKNGQIFAHKSTARGPLDLQYLDEISSRKVSLREAAGVDDRIGQSLKGFIDYASKESLGQVHAGGFLHHRIRSNCDGTSTAPSQLSNDERKRRITSAWLEHLRRFLSAARRPVVAHRLVFSMSREQHDALVSSGINPDQVLHSTMKKIMRKFAERFHAGDSVGYACGFHHDTDHLHVHVALCPRTDKGSYVGCSASRHASSRHKGQMNVIRTWFEQENDRWAEILGDPRKLDAALSQRLDSDLILFAPRLNHLQLDALRAAQNREAVQLQQLYRNIHEIEKAIAVRRAAARLRRQVRFAGRFFKTRKAAPVEQVVSKFAAATERHSLRQQQHTLFNLKRQYRALHTRYSNLYGFHSYAHRNAHNQHSSQQQQDAH